MTPLAVTILIWIDLAEATRRRNTVFYHGASRRYLPSDQLYRGGSAIFDRGAAGFTGIGSPGISKSPALVEGHGDTPMPVDAHHLVAAAPLWATDAAKHYHRRFDHLSPTCVRVGRRSPN